MKYNKQEFIKATDEEKMEIIKTEMAMETHNRTTKADLLMLIEWMYGKLARCVCR